MQIEEIRQRQQRKEDESRRQVEELKQTLAARTAELTALQQQRDRELQDLRTQLATAQTAAEKMRKKKDRTESEVIACGPWVVCTDGLFL